jgi:hypothetical protein
VLLEKDNEPVLDLSAVQVGRARNRCERLASMSRKDRVYPL